jgi:hypothetical protein
MTTSSFIKYLLLVVVATTTEVQSFFTLAPAATNANTAAVKNTLSDKQIIELAKDYVTNRNGFYKPVDADAHAEDFIFKGGVVGPLNKADYCTTMTKLGIGEAFDLEPNAFGFCVDPQVKNTARFYVRYTGRQVKDWKVAGTPFDIPPEEGNKRPIVGPTESICVQFDDEGKARFSTISAPMTFGNPEQHTTGQLGAVLGLFNHVGLEVAASSALNSNVRWAGNTAADLLPDDVSPPRTASKSEDLPTWWKGY